ncbi:MAG: AraC family transcriptional regulator [Planctomycetota bacterium]|nr:AraC family transcriptional regulator [Planctomycetota bacterium]
MARRTPPGETFDPLRTPPRVLLANFYPFAPGEVALPRWSRSNLFLPCTGGRGTVQVGTRRFALRTGQVLHVPWATPLQYEADSRDPFVVIGVHLAYTGWNDRHAPVTHHAYRGVELVDRPAEAPPCVQPFEGPFVLDVPAGSPLLERAAAVATAFEGRARAEGDPDREARLRAAALAFLVEFRACRARAAGAGSPAQAGLVRELISYLELAYATRLTRGDLARRAGVSESTLAAAFRAATGKAPIDYLIDLRLDHARRLLSTGRQRVGEIARAVGIADAYYFSKLFKRRVGVAPLAYRKRLRL